MRTRILLTITAILAMHATISVAQQNPGAREIANEFKRFIRSKDLKLLYDHNGKGLFVHHFKYTCKGREIGDTTFVPPVIRRLENAFDRNTVHSEGTFFHKPGLWQWPIREMRLSWPDDYWDRVRFYFPLFASRNYRFATFGEPDSVRSCYALVWHSVSFTDKDDKPCRCIDGYIFELTGNHWRMEPAGESYRSNREKAHVMQDMYTTQQDTTAYIRLKEQVRKLKQIYTDCHARNAGEAMDAMVYTLYNIGNTYKNSYTKEQFATIAADLDTMLAITPKESGRSMLITKTRNSLAEKATAYSKAKIVRGNNIKFMQKRFEEKSMTETYIINDTTLGPMLDWQITGKTRPGHKQVLISCVSLPRSSKALQCFAEGSFTWKDRLHRYQFVRIDMDDEPGWTVIADGIPLSIDIESGEVTEGSEMNRRLIDYQKRINRMLAEAKKYTTDIDNYKQVIDRQGFDAIVDSVREIQAEAMRDNQDNMIPALFLSQGYTNMTYGQLWPLMQRDRPYAAHMMMQPVWDYYEGLKKRLPGMAFTDVELQDTLGVSHRLSEFVGRGYVLLHFWSTANVCGRSDIPTLKFINRLNGKDSITVIGISLNNDLNDWKKYIDRRGMHYLQMADKRPWDNAVARAYGLTTLPGMILIGPDGRIVAEDLRGGALTDKVKELIGAE